MGIFDCPEGMDLRENHASIPCADEECIDTAATTCCAPEGKCDTMKSGATNACPAGTVLRDGASERRCQGFKCHDSDAATCCKPVAKCNEHICDTTNILRHNNVNIPCKGAECTSADDEATCCVSKGNCLSLECPHDFLHLATAKDTDCDDELCKATDYTKCCGAPRKCKTLSCLELGAQYKPRAAAQDTLCEKWKCEESDRDACCDEVRKCSSHTCALEGKVLKVDNSDRFCANDQCDDAQCCDDAGTCDNFQDCPAGYDNKEDASKFFCSDQECTDTPWAGAVHHKANATPWSVQPARF